ncbi:DUF2589 domain-containing protein [Francisella hispaniensis]|uniref:DUF2589 domain-containing protein n=1 Tax=Francisella hispaniensis FSC454 TaxID=1088883 RepID=A0AAC9J8Z8_9GAMM|nr:DUF2589 domain-containing protein [Francisella hispaniensis]APD51345.1 hypothetical protein FSC454_09390 [Francisella hispaniensis FSC454]KYW82582.1 hypothetical protein AUF42_01460 [Francisella hispaniensis FSC454]MBK2357826.1 DUF2589 domain-containing protein [Francisella hispaniensis]
MAIFKKKENKPLTAQKLSDIMRGLQNSALSVNKLIARHHLNTLSRFFDEQEDGSLKAKMVNVNLTDDYSIQVPLVSLYSPANITLNKMKVSMSMKFQSEFLKEIKDKNLEQGTSFGSFDVSIGPKDVDSTKSKRRPTDIIDFELEFIAKESPEALNKVIDEFTKLIIPSINNCEDKSNL